MFTSVFPAVMFVGLLTGTFGSMVGLGGGVLLVPLLTLGLGVPIHQAIGASLVAVIATSSAAATAYLEDHFTNVRLAMVLETTTVCGAILGGLSAVALSRTVLTGLFAAALAFVGVAMVCRQTRDDTPMGETAGSLALGGSYYDPVLRRRVRYGVRNLPVGLAVSFVAGNISGLLGIGGGVIKVPALVLAMGVPIRAAVATSNFMIGVTAVASAYIYYSRGFIVPQVAVPTAVGVFLGALLGTRLVKRLQARWLEVIFALVLLVFAAQMALQALGLAWH
ncbi:MAG: sulfite exporter TauE/SafE family protein [Clostridia bacterium]|nr:sulfite exporter TauE/SafE family protein [Clostridia bacterium]